MRVAMTIDDLPLWPQSYPPEGYTAALIMQRISDALAKNGISGVYGFGNSWALTRHPELAGAMDAWTSAGHYIGNHTHSHPELPDIDARTYCREIDDADAYLAQWLDRAPTRFFRYPVCHWGETAEKRDTVARHLAAKGYKVADVTTWLFEWTWNRAWLNARDRNDRANMMWLEREFVEASLAQLSYDQSSLVTWFGREVPAIALGHTLPFFAEVADALLARFVAAGVTFIPLEEAVANPAYDEVGSVVSSKFLVFHQKLADAAGKPIPVVSPDIKGLHRRVMEMAGNRRD
ncbi:Polysaccharide deacetylase [Mesorhizobium sp. NFR06]|uniref:polysaccharide deacetylase family protein n=1 Tax=Mesorhizobium sp. NFR06 TaxID=1566290 RepID=UPI0008DEEDB2|nr:polysaccharide deacetylase family protein [Mesorhizobium sp. NFR06]SFO66287.1 Polysaccharide deacetylase [Mesorhizobium sp. NFR06]